MALNYPEIDPVALRLGPIAIRWYGLAYITGLILGWRYTVWLARQKQFNGPGTRPTATDLDDFLFWAMAGVLIGGRLLTQFDTKAIPCGRDNAGDKDIIITYG